MAGSSPRGPRGLAWACAGAAVLGFFLPWIRLEIRQAAPLVGLLEGAAERSGRITATVRRGTQTLTGTLPTLDDLPRSVSGVDVPRLVRAEHAQLAITLFEVLTGTRRHLALKSLLVYLVPGVALLCSAVLSGPRRRAAAVAVAIGCALVAGGGAWRLATVETPALVALEIGPGLWVSVAAYAGLAAAAVWVTAASPRRQA